MRVSLDTTSNVLQIIIIVLRLEYCVWGDLLYGALKSYILKDKHFSH